MNRVACFAHWDNYNIIQNYVIFYLKELKKVAEKIIFVSAVDISENELEKIKPYIYHAITGKHDEYDFGSYKKAFLYAKENGLLENCDELIFANDSCYAPLFPFKDMFNKMSNKNIDFWGPTENCINKENFLCQYHVQSYFLVFKPQVFMHECFYKFMYDIKKEKTKKDIILKYEICLSELLIHNGFKYDVYCTFSKKMKGAFLYEYRKLIREEKYPFLKRSIILYKNIKTSYPIFTRIFITLFTNYKYSLIRKDKKINVKKIQLKKHIRYFLREINKRQGIINKRQTRITMFGKTIIGIKELDFRLKVINIFGIKIKYKKIFLKKRIKTWKEKNLILKSGFWDADWYIKKYHPNFSKKEVLDYWYEKGWFNNELPSKYFDNNYLNSCKILGVNPIIRYISKVWPSFPNNCNPYKSEKDKNRIEQYLEYKKTRKAKGVVYTCITNDYDDIREIEIYKYIDKDWDYVCFTDNKNGIKQAQIGIWEIRPLQFCKLDNTRNQRWHKTKPHLLFPQYKCSIYIDSNINILSSFLFDFINKNQSIIILPRHFERNCIYAEYDIVLKYNIDDKNIVNKELNILKFAKMPHDYGLCENNVIYRKHNNEKIIDLMNEWWYMISNYSKRDQLSLMYLFWKRRFDMKNITFENTRLDTKNFYVFAHKK